MWTICAPAQLDPRLDRFGLAGSRRSGWVAASCQAGPGFPAIVWLSAHGGPGHERPGGGGLSHRHAVGIPGRRHLAHRAILTEPVLPRHRLRRRGQGHRHVGLRGQHRPGLLRLRGHRSDPHLFHGLRLDLFGPFFLFPTSSCSSPSAWPSSGWPTPSASPPSSPLVRVTPRWWPSRAFIRRPAGSPSTRWP